MYDLYVKERENLEEIRTEYGFIHYRINSGECFISDYFVHPDHRGSGLGYELADMVLLRAKQAGCEFLSCCVYLNAKNSSISLSAILKYGFKLYSAEHGKIELIKEIGE